LIKNAVKDVAFAPFLALRRRSGLEKKSTARDIFLWSGTITDLAQAAPSAGRFVRMSPSRSGRIPKNRWGDREIGRKNDKEEPKLKLTGKGLRHHGSTY